MQRTARIRSKSEDVVRPGDGAKLAGAATLIQQFGPDQVPAHRRIETPADLHQRIAARAYELASLRGFTNGGELDDWLQAERELLQATLL